MRRYKKNKNIINQMNVVPYIDVMLVLLIIFMATAPMFVPGVINLPSVGKSSQVTKSPIEINIDKNRRYTITQNNKTDNASGMNDVIVRVKSMIKSLDIPVVISADKDISYNDVINVVDQLYSSGVKKVALVVKQKA
ncbi:MAG: biopolymer transporter ExbD [Burkholderiales bacterium]|nr:biopolymer transporter ExbD [Burkholderiales bacterium]